MRKKFFTIIFVLSWFAVFCIMGSLDQYIISTEQAIISSIIALAALGISGFLSGMLTKPEYPDKFNHKK